MNERVQIIAPHGMIELSWSAREALLHEIRHLEGARGIVDLFGAAGTSRPVPLTEDDVGVLYEAINQWADGVTVDALPPGIWELRCALAGKVQDTLHPS